MIQRIQSFLLVLAVCGAALCMMFPVATYGEYPALRLWRFSPYNWYLTVLNLLVGAIALVSIFLYKNRVRQMRVVAVAGLLCIVQLALTLFVAPAHYAAHCAPGTDPALTPGAYIPIVTTLLLFIAQRCIRSDEMKVRAADRIR